MKTSIFKLTDDEKYWICRRFSKKGCCECPLGRLSFARGLCLSKKSEKLKKDIDVIIDDKVMSSVHATITKHKMKEKMNETL